MIDRTASPVRICPDCNKPWPLLTIHLCPELIHPKQPEALAALIFDMLTDIPVEIGATVDIATSLAVVVSLPLAVQIHARWDDVVAACMEDDRDG